MKLTVLDDFTKKDKIEGIIESTGDVAVVNGKKVRLTAGSFLTGKTELRKKVDMRENIQIIFRSLIWVCY
jgi:hypothetical protein